MTCQDLRARMTDRSRCVMDLAERQARRAGLPTIGPEHVLYGLMEEGHGVAARVLENFGFQIIEFQRSAGGNKPTDHPVAGPMEWSAETARCIERAREETKVLGHSYIGTEHLLIGVAFSGGEPVTEGLQQWGVTPDEIREEVWAILGHGL